MAKRVPHRAGVAEAGAHPEEVGTVRALLYVEVSQQCWCAKLMLVC